MEQLAEGSKYIIHSIGASDKMLVTTGTFSGYSSIGKGEGGICIKMDSSHEKLYGKTRIIPISMIHSIDIIKAAKTEHKEETTHYYR